MDFRKPILSNDITAGLSLRHGTYEWKWRALKGTPVHVVERLADNHVLCRFECEAGKVRKKNCP